MTKEYHGVDVACTAENHLNPFPSASNHRMLSVNCKSSFANDFKYNFPLVGPSTVTINGSSSLHITRPGQIGPFSCFTDESHPPSELHVVINDDKETVLEPIITKHPKMKATHGFASMMEFSFKLETYAEEIKIQCTASNGESYLTVNRSISIQSMNQTYLRLSSNPILELREPAISLDGPKHYFADEEVHYNCSMKFDNIVQNVLRNMN